jgi:hypothetical protein
MLRLMAATALLLAESCTGAHVAAPPSEICGQAAGPIVMQTTPSGECISMTARRPEGTPTPVPGFDVSGPYWVEGFTITRSPCEFPAAPFDSSSSAGFGPAGTAVSTEEGARIHLRVQARVDFPARDAYPAVTRDVDVDLLFSESEVRYCTSP